MWKILESNVALDNPWMRILSEKVELPNGENIEYLFWKRRDVCYAVTMEGDKFVMVKEYKHAVRKTVIQFPAGYIEEGEDPGVAARRELREETGYEGALTQIGVTHPDASKVQTQNHYYFGHVQKVGEQTLEATEQTKVVLYTAEKIQHMINHGIIQEAGSIVGFYLALPYLKG